jgi:ParB family chromosome partitioning protein
MAQRKRLDFAGVAEPVRIGETARTILHKTVDDGVGDLDMAKEIRLDLIEPDPDQPRRHFDEESLQELAQSIRVQGVLQPIVVEWVSERERFRIISGERRWRAARLVAESRAAARPDDVTSPRRDISRIPAIVRNPGAVDRYIQQIYENEQRRDYSDVERAFAYERLRETLAITWEELATKLGLSKGRIHQIRRTKNRLAPAVQDDITSGHLTGRHGLYLAPLPEFAQERVAAAVKDRHLTHQQTQVLVQRVRAAIDGAVSAESPAEPPVVAESSPQIGGAQPADATNVASTSDPEVESSVAAVGSAPHLVEPALVPASSARVADAVEKAVAEVNVRPGDIVRSPREQVDRALALMRQLVRLNITAPIDPRDHGKLAAALTDVENWTRVLRERLLAEKV